MTNILSLFRQSADDTITEQAMRHAFASGMDAPTLPMPSLLEHDSEKVGQIIAKRRDSVRTLELQIERLTEDLRQTRISVAAFEAAWGVLAHG